MFRFRMLIKIVFENRGCREKASGFVLPENLDETSRQRSVQQNYYYEKGCAPKMCRIVNAHVMVSICRCDGTAFSLGFLSLPSRISLDGPSLSPRNPRETDGEQAKHRDSTKTPASERTCGYAPAFPDKFYIGNIIDQILLLMLKPFFVWQNRMLKKISPDQVMCLSTEGNYTRIFLADKTFYMVRTTFATALKKLPSDMFIKLDRSFEASVYYIDNIYKYHLVIGDEAIPIAKSYYKSLLAKLNIIE